MKRFFVSQYGYHYPNPEALELEEARKEMVKEARQSLSTAKRRGHKSATYHRLSADCVRVTLGKDSESTLYSHFSIQPI